MAERVVTLRVPADWPQQMRLLMTKLLARQAVDPADLERSIRLLGEAEVNSIKQQLTYDRQGRVTLGDAKCSTRRANAPKTAA